MRACLALLLLLATLLATSLVFPAQRPAGDSSAGQTVTSGQGPSGQGTIAEVYYWKAKPGKLADYNRYIREFAEPIDHEAQRRGAFLSVTTYLASKPDAPWTHMRIFILRDQAQQQALAKALDDAKIFLHPSEKERQQQAAYAETLRDLAGHETLEIMH